MKTVSSSRRLTSVSTTSVAVIIGLVGLFGPVACTDSETVEPEGSSSSEIVCSSANAKKLAGVASRMNGKKSQHLCYRYVKSHLKDAGFAIGPIAGQGSAAMFAEWAKANPRALLKMGFEKVNVPLTALPRGAVLVWRRGQCGYSKAHGHIEIVIDDKSSRACSDFCGNIKKTCGAPDIFVPRGCSPASSTSAERDVPLPPPRPEDEDDNGDVSGEDGADSDSDSGETESVPLPPERRPPPTDNDDALDGCSGKSNGWYCSALDMSSAYRCESQASVDAWSCADSTVCRPDSRGRATLHGQNPGCFGSR